MKKINVYWEILARLEAAMENEQKVMIIITNDHLHFYTLFDCEIEVYGSSNGDGYTIMPQIEDLDEFELNLTPDYTDVCIEEDDVLVIEYKDVVISFKIRD